MDKLRVTATPFSIPFRTALKVGGSELHCREGVRLEVWSGSRLLGAGDAAPLFGFSDESYSDVLEQSRQLMGIEIGLPELKSLETVKLLCDRLSNALSPSLRFASEMALLRASAAISSGPICQFLGGVSLDYSPVSIALIPSSISINDLSRYLGEKRALGYRHFKLKLLDSVRDSLDLIDMVLQAMRPGEILRLDGECRWDIEGARQVLAYIENLESVMYIEDPVKTVDDLAALLESGCRKLALDHLELDSIPPLIAAVVVKPTLRYGVFGSFDLCASLEPTTGLVLSSAYDTPDTVAFLQDMAGVLRADLGVDTLAIFSESCL